MNILLLMVVLLLLFGGGGFYFGGPVVGGSGLGLILLVCLVIYFAGGFHGRIGECQPAFDRPKCLSHGKHCFYTDSVGTGKAGNNAWQLRFAGEAGRIN